MLAIGAFVIATMLDASSTCMALRAGGTERNPFLPQSCAGITAIKAGIGGGVILGIESLPKSHGKLRTVLYITATGVTLGAAVHNYRQASK